MDDDFPEPEGHRYLFLLGALLVIGLVVSLGFSLAAASVRAPARSVAGLAVGSLPVAVLDHPRPYAQVNGVMLLQARGSAPDGIAALSFFADDVFIGVDDSAPFEIMWDTTHFPNGRHALQVNARSLSGQSAVSALVPVDVNNIG